MSYIKEAGTYEVTVKDAGFATSKQKGTPYIFLILVTDAKEQVEAQFWLTDTRGGQDNKTPKERAINTLRQAFGINDNFATLKEQVVDKRCSIAVEMQEYEGKEYAKVKWLNPLRAPRAEMSDKDDFIAQLSAQAARLPRPADALPPQSEVTRKEPENEDVPF